MKYFLEKLSQRFLWLVSQLGLLGERSSPLFEERYMICFILKDIGYSIEVVKSQKKILGQVNGPSTLTCEFFPLAVFLARNLADFKTPRIISEF